MHYRTNWLVVILLALGLHGAVFGGLILVRPLLDGSAEEVASEVGTTIELEDAPQSGEGEETKDPGYEDGAEGGSLVGEALPGKGLENIKAADISNEPAAETDIVKVMEERENPPPDTEPEPLEETEADVPEEKADTEPIVAENEKDAVKKFQQQIEDAKKDPKKKNIKYYRGEEKKVTAVRIRWVSRRKSSWILIRRKECIHLKALSVCLRRSEKMGR